MRAIPAHTRYNTNQRIPRKSNISANPSWGCRVPVGWSLGTEQAQWAVPRRIHCGVRSGYGARAETRSRIEEGKHPVKRFPAGCVIQVELVFMRRGWITISREEEHVDADPKPTELLSERDSLGSRADRHCRWRLSLAGRQRSLRPVSPGQSHSLLRRCWLFWQ